MIRLLRLSCPFVASVLLAAAASAQTTDPGIEKVRTDYEQAWKKADAKAIAALYTENAITVNPAGVVMRGRAAIETNIAENFAGPFKGTTIAITPGATQVVTPDVAVGEGTYTITGVTGPDGKPMPVQGHYVNTLVKRGTSWAIAGSGVFEPQPPGPATRKTP